MPDSAYADYLQSPARTFVQTNAVLQARWGDKARMHEALSCLSTEAGATAAATAIGDFLGGPLADELVIVEGLFDVSAYRGRCHAFNGITMFVLGGDADRGRGVTDFYCLRRL